MLLIWQFFQIILLFTCVPETYVPVILKHKARRYARDRSFGCVRTSVLTNALSRLRKTESEKYYAPIEVQKRSLFHMILFSIYTPFSKRCAICQDSS